MTRKIPKFFGVATPATIWKKPEKTLKRESKMPRTKLTSRRNVEMLAMISKMQAKTSRKESKTPRTKSKKSAIVETPETILKMQERTSKRESKTLLMNWTKN